MMFRSTRRAALALLASSTLLVGGCLGGGDTTTAPYKDPDIGTVTFASALGVDLTAMTKTSDGLYMQDLAAGTGATATAGHSVTVGYTGWIPSGAKFDASADHGSNFSFVLGAGQVIPGWDEGVAGMKVGGRRRLVIPPSLAYGPDTKYDQNGKVIIPANSYLVFDIQLVAVQ